MDLKKCCGQSVVDRQGLQQICAEHVGGPELSHCGGRYVSGGVRHIGQSEGQAQ